MIRIELRNIKVDERLSEETLCYSALLVVDGAQFATVGNAGHGGADRVIAFMPPFGPSDLKQVEERVASDYPKLDMSAYGMEPIDRSLEVVCQGLVEDHLRERALDRALRNRVSFFQLGLPQEGTTAPLLSIAMQRAKGRRPADTEEALIAYVEKTYPGAYILNGRPREEQMQAYLRAS